MLWACLSVHVNSIMLGMEHCVLTLINALMLFIIVILVIQCVLMLWACLSDRLHSIYCILKLMNVLMVLIIVMLVLQRVLMV